MTISIESPDIASTQAWVASLLDITTREAAEKVLFVSEKTADEVQREMPVDTGWAQGRWGEPGFGGVWEVRDNGLTIEQGTDIVAAGYKYEYVIRLNEGSSTQAPAGFIDAAAERAGDDLETRLDEIATVLDNS